MATILFSRVCNAPALRLSVLKQIPRKPIFRSFANECPRDTLRRAHLKTIRERARFINEQATKERPMAPPTETTHNIGRGALAAGGALGIAALCFYGLGMSDEPGALEKSMLWPQHVKDRIKTTYLYFGSTIGVTAASAVAAFHNPLIGNLTARGGLVGILMGIGAIMGSGMIAQGIPYKSGFGAKQMAWLFHASVIGAVLAPMCSIGGPVLMKAAWCTAGIVGGLSSIAICAPSEQFLMLGGPLAMCLGVLVTASLGSMFLGPASALGAGIHTVSLYGGLLLFAGLLLYDTQKIIMKSERYTTHPEDGIPPFDPINASLSIYMDTLNIFVRIATILAGGGSNRRK